MKVDKIKIQCIKAIARFEHEHFSRFSSWLSEKRLANLPAVLYIPGPNKDWDGRDEELRWIDIFEDVSHRCEFERQASRVKGLIILEASSFLNILRFARRCKRREQIEIAIGLFEEFHDGFLDESQPCLDLLQSGELFQQDVQKKNEKIRKIFRRKAGKVLRDWID